MSKLYCSEINPSWPLDPLSAGIPVLEGTAVQILGTDLIAELTVGLMYALVFTFFVPVRAPMIISSTA